MRRPPVDYTVAAAVERAERRSRGEDPFLAPLAPPKARRGRAKPATTGVALSPAEYKRLLEAAKCDESIGWCERCGAWLDHDDPAFLRTEEFEGCVYAATGRKADGHLCRSHRAPGEVRHG